LLTAQPPGSENPRKKTHATANVAEQWSHAAFGQEISSENVSHSRLVYMDKWSLCKAEAVYR